MIPTSPGDFFGEKIKNMYIECCFACCLSFILCSLFQLVVLRLGHVLASNCDLYFGYLLNFATLHSFLLLLATYCTTYPTAPHILRSVQVHFATVTPSSTTDCTILVGFGKNTCKTVVSRLRFCTPLPPPSTC